MFWVGRSHWGIGRGFTETCAGSGLLSPPSCALLFAPRCPKTKKLDRRIEREKNVARDVLRALYRTSAGEAITSVCCLPICGLFGRKRIFGVFAATRHVSLAL